MKEQDDLDKAIKRFMTEILTEWKSFAYIVSVILAFLSGMAAEHYFSDLTSFLWK